jgi:hypothetical protein
MSARFRTMRNAFCDSAEAALLLIAFRIAALLWPAREMMEE